MQRYTDGRFTARLPFSLIGRPLLLLVREGNRIDSEGKYIMDYSGGVRGLGVKLTLLEAERMEKDSQVLMHPRQRIPD